MRWSEETDDNIFAYFDMGGLTATDGIFCFCSKAQLWWALGATLEIGGPWHFLDFAPMLI